MTPSTSLPGHARGMELDLDTSPEPSRSRRWPRLAAAVVALLLAGTGSGVAAQALVAAEPAPAPPQAEISLLEGHLEAEPVATLRLTVHNAAAVTVVVSHVVVEGVQRSAVTTPIGTSVAPGATVAVPVRTAPDCGRSLSPGPLRARLLLGDGRRVQVVPARVLASAGGLCRQLRTVLPRGWQDPLAGASVRWVGADVEVQLPPVPPRSRVAGVWAGEKLLTPRDAYEENNGVIEPFRLLLPDQCVGARESTGVPSGLRVLLITQDGLRERYTPLGTEFARWLLGACRPT